MHRKQHQKRTAIRDIHIQQGTSLPTIPIQQGIPLPTIPVQLASTSLPTIPVQFASTSTTLSISAQPLAPPALTPTVAGSPLSDIPPLPVTWLWQDRLPRGSITLLDGPLGSGKSLLALHIAACLTSGQPLPDGTPCTPSPVILVAPSSNARHTLRPRLEAAGGDPSRVLLLNSVSCIDKRLGTTFERPFTLKEDLKVLEITIFQLHAPLVILDTPELARPGLLRRLLPALAQLADRSNCAILLVHPVLERLFRKKGSQHPNSGPLDLLAAVPSRLLLAPNPQDPEQSLLLTTKHSLSQQPSTLLFEIIVPKDGVPTLDWLGDYQDLEVPKPPANAPQSLHRQHILQHLHTSNTPLDAPHLAAAIDHGYDATRKLLQYMLQDGQLVSPARGLYTSPNHPCLAPHPTSTPPTEIPSPIPIIPSIPISTTAEILSSIPSIPSIPITQTPYERDDEQEQTHQDPNAMPIVATKRSYGRDLSRPAGG